MPDGDSGWTAKYTRVCTSFRKRLYYVLATFIIKNIIRFYYLSMEISVNNPAYRFICLCQDVNVISMCMGEAEQVGLKCNAKHIECPSQPTCAM